MSWKLPLSEVLELQKRLESEQERGESPPELAGEILGLGTPHQSRHIKTEMDG